MVSRGVQACTHIISEVSGATACFALASGELSVLRSQDALCRVDPNDGLFCVLHSVVRKRPDLGWVARGNKLCVLLVPAQALRASRHHPGHGLEVAGEAPAPNDALVELHRPSAMAPWRYWQQATNPHEVVHGNERSLQLLGPDEHGMVAQGHVLWRHPGSTSIIIRCITRNRLVCIKPCLHVPIHFGRRFKQRFKIEIARRPCRTSSDSDVDGSFSSRQRCPSSGENNMTC